MNRVSTHSAPPIDRLLIDLFQIDHFQVLLHSCSIIACYKYTSELPQSWPRSVSLSSLNLDLQLHLQTRTITASKFMSKLAQSRPPSASLSSLNLGLQLHFQTRSIAPSQCISAFTQFRSPIASPNSLDHGLKVHLQSRSITASQCISKLDRSWLSSLSLSSLN
jgi:hypothetical protein